MSRKLLIILMLAVLVLTGGCLEHLMPDQFSLTRFEDPMGEEYYLPGLSWDIPQLSE